MSLNKVFLIGHLGKDPELRLSRDQRPFCYFSLATNEYVQTKSGAETRTEWHNIVVFGQTATLCATRLKKGAQIFLEGTLRTAEYETENNQRARTTKIISSKITFLTSSRLEEDRMLELQLEEDET